MSVSLLPLPLLLPPTSYFSICIILQACVCLWDSHQHSSREKVLLVFVFPFIGIGTSNPMLFCNNNRRRSKRKMENLSRAARGGMLLKKKSVKRKRNVMGFKIGERVFVFVLFSFCFPSMHTDVKKEITSFCFVAQVTRAWLPSSKNDGPQS